MSDPASNPQKPRRRWLRRAAILLVVLFLSEQGVNLWLRQGWLGAGRVHRALAARLEVTFGRRIEVGYFQVSLFGRPRIEANSVTVAEDPRFGYEYFLRAEQLSAGLRWRSLLLGRVEFGTVSFTRPSLNLVRNASGEWNLASWLPAPRPPMGPEAPGHGRIYRVEVDGGRVNFTQGYDKHPFALVGVTGTFEQESPGRWRVDIESELMRSTVTVQEAGTIRVRGRIGGTAARLRPAELQVTCEQASLADVLRLAREQDFGVRGEVSLDFTARTGTDPASPAGAWSASGVARLRGIHRWDLPPRASDPALNLHFDAAWQPETARVELTRGVIEGPGSSINTVGSFSWAEGKDLRLRFTSSGITMGDAFAWYRAFRPGVAESTTLDGNAGLDLQLAGWPPHIEQGAFAADGVSLRARGLASPVTLGRVLVRSSNGALVLNPVALLLPGASPAGNPQPAGPPRTRAARKEPAVETRALRLEGKAALQENQLELKLAGRINGVQDALAALSALGWTPFAGWTIEGEAGVNVQWQGSILPFRLALSGTLEPRRVSLQPPFLNQPVLLQDARLEFEAGQRRVRIAAAQALGARWTGSLLRPAAASPWEFALNADRLDVAEASRWFGVRDRSLLERLAPSGAAAAQGAPGWEARGRITVGQLALAPLVWQRLSAQVELGGVPWRLRLTDAQADFYGGSVAGSLDAEAEAGPSYRFDGRFQRVNMELLSGATASLARRFAGTATGVIHLAARGRTREDLLASLEGGGSVDVRGAEIRGMNLPGWLESGSAAPGSRTATSAFASASGAFTLGSRAVQIQTLQLVAPRAELEASGTVDFAQALNLQVRPSFARVASSKPAAAEPARRGIRITGTFAAPQVAPLEELPPR